MALFQDVALEGTAYFHFASNDTGGTAGDGASALFRVRLGGAASNAAPVYSGNPTLLTEATYPDGCYEVAIPATAVNGFAAGNTYGVFCTLTVDGEGPAGFLGGLKVVATADTLHDAAAKVMDNLTVGTATLAQPGDEMTLTSLYDEAKTPAQVGDAMTLAEHAVNTTSIADAIVTQLANLDATISSRGTADPGDEMTLTSPYDAAKTAAAVGAAMTLAADSVDGTSIADAIVTLLNRLDADVSSRGTADPGDQMTLTSLYDSAKTAAATGAAMTLAADAVDGTSIADAIMTLLNRLDATVSSRGTADTGDEMTLTSAYDAAKVAAAVGAAMTLAEHAVSSTSIADAIMTLLNHLDADVSSRGTADTGDEMTLTSAYDKAKTAAQAGDEMAVSSHTTGAKAELQVEANDALVAYGAAQEGDAMTLTSAYDNAKTAAAAGAAMTLSAGAIAAATFAANAIADAAVAADMDVYSARVTPYKDEANVTDYYLVHFYKNNQPFAGTVTGTPTIQIITATTGADLIAAKNLTQSGSTKEYYTTALTTARFTAGLPYTAVITATLDDVVRTMRGPVGRDSAAA